MSACVWVRVSVRALISVANDDTISRRRLNCPPVPAGRSRVFRVAGDSNTSYVLISEATN